MNKFWVVLSQTYLTRFKSKSFKITTALFLVFILAIGNIDRIIELFNSDEETSITTVAVIDETNLYGDYLTNIESQSLEYEESSDEVSSLNDAVLAGEIDGVLTLSSDEIQPFTATLRLEDVLNNSLEYEVNEHLQQLKVMVMTEEAGIDGEVLQSIYSPVSFQLEAIEKADGTTSKTEEEISGARGLVYVMLFLLYFAVITYGQMIATDIANEKTSRVMEILISSSSPVSQMFAKIIGIALLGLTQISILIATGFFVIQTRSSDFEGDFFEVFGFSDIDVLVYIYALVFFLLGYLLYATLSAMLGSLVSRMEDVGQLMFPVIILIVIAFMVSMFGLESPESTLVTVMSYIPFFSPLVMFLRVGLLGIPFYEVMLSISILLVTIFILGYVGAKVYRGGVLMYGGGFKLKDLKQVMHLSKKSK